MNKLVLSSVLLVLLTACNKFHVEGTSSVSMYDGRLISVKVMGEDDLITVDSCEIVHGKFSLSGRLDSAQVAFLYLDNQAAIPFVLEKGRIKVSISDAFIDATGTPQNNKLNAFFTQAQSISTRADELQRRENQMILDGYGYDEIQEMLQEEGDAVAAEMGTLIVEFITSNFDNLLARNFFIMLFADSPFPSITSEMEAIINAAPKSFLEDPIIRDFLEVASENTRMLEEMYAQEEE